MLLTDLKNSGSWDILEGIFRGKYHTFESLVVGLFRVVTPNYLKLFVNFLADIYSGAHLREK